MCNFLSGITLENGDVLISKNTDSHHEILTEFGIADKELPPAFVAWEWTPPIKNERYDFDAPLDVWIFNVDSAFPKPEWWDKGREAITIKECKKRVKSFLINTTIEEIKEGRFVLFGNAQITYVSDNAVLNKYNKNETKISKSAVIIDRCCDTLVIITAKNRFEDK